MALAHYPHETYIAPRVGDKLENMNGYCHVSTILGVQPYLKKYCDEIQQDEYHEYRGHKIPGNSLLANKNLSVLVDVVDFHGCVGFLERY